MRARFAFLWLACLVALQVHATDFHAAGSTRTVAPNVTVDAWQAQLADGEEFDRIGLQRYGPAAGEVRAALFYLPGTNMNGSSAGPDEATNLFYFLAARGIAVYALDYRTRAVPPDYDGSLGFMRGWTLDAFVNDANLALGFAAAEERQGLAFFAAGFSRGVSIGYGLLNVADMPFAGFIALDGGFKHYAPGEPFDRKAGMASLAESGRWASTLSRSRSWENRHQLMRRAYTNPDGPAMDGKSASMGAQLSDTLYRAWGPGVLANPRDGISDVTVLARLLDTYDWFYPTVQNVDGRSVASQRDDPATKIDDRWGKLDVPIIYFGAANFGTEALLTGIYSASYAGSKDVTIHVLENHGHLDVIVGKRSRAGVFEPTLRWIDARL